MASESTVFDNTSADLLIKMAADEGLLEDDPQKSDSYLASRQRRSFPQWVREQVLEQVLYAPRTVCIGPESAQGWLKGKLLDDGLLEFAPWPRQSLTMNTLSRRVVSGLLAARGYDELAGSPDDALERYNRAVIEIRAFKERTGKELPRLGRPSKSENLASETMKKVFQRSDYTDEEYREGSQLWGEYKGKQPIADCIREYEMIATAAEERGALLRTPLLPGGNEMSVQNLLAPAKQFPPSINLLRIAGYGLGQIPFRSTLRETLELAGEPATIALRQRIGDWLTAWANTNEQDIRRIYLDIEEARTALAKLGPLKVARTLIAYVAVAASVAEIARGLPPEMGFSISLAGAGIESRIIAVESKYRWSMFGSIG